MQTFSLLECPSYLAGQVNKLAQPRLLELLAPHGLRPTHLAVLVALRDFGPLSQQRLAQVLRLDKSHIVAIVDDLAQAALLRREVDEADRRRHQVTLTATGARLARRLFDAVERCQREIFRGLTDVERAQLTALLRRALEAGNAEPASSRRPAVTERA